ncbi:hypothetical protein BDM02DRAFT_3095826, partial [Thelephora ganbajun]
AKLPRSRSSPSPPPSQRSGSQRDARRAVPIQRNRRPSIAANPSYDWSTSYQAGSSGTASSASTDDGDTTTDTDDDHATLRGRQTSHSRPGRYNAAVKPPTTGATKTRRDSVSSTSGSPGRHHLRPVRLSFTRSKSPLPPTQAANGNDAPPSPISPRPSDQRRSPLPPTKNDGFVWMTVPKNYRNSSDDGILSGLLIGPLIASAELYTTLKSVSTGRPLLPPEWRVDSTIFPLSEPKLTQAEALVVSRRALVDLATICSVILLIHVCASWWKEARVRKDGLPETERASVPRSEMRRLRLYVVFGLVVSLAVVAMRAGFHEMGWGIWQNMSPIELLLCSLFYQVTLYLAIRLAHQGFTLGELGIVVFGASVLFMEGFNITVARIWPAKTPFIRTYRLPTPLLLYQIALIPGSLLTGILLSPLLFLSRHIARRPVRRLRFPQEKQVHRRLLALGFYAGAALIIGGLIGMWTKWCLGGRDPWMYAIFYLLEGRKTWSRPVLLVYWAFIGTISVAAWNRQLARSRKYRPRAIGNPETAPQPAVPSTPTEARQPVSSDLSAPPTPTIPSMISFPNLPNGVQMSLAATELLDAADKRVPTLTLNARRKSFHGIAVLMFLPGIGFDPAFTHLAFSAAFSLFIFAEYVRYFALYPFGASVHVFMNEFLDNKDTGTAILSHFYLLTGCANSVWFEGPSQLLHFTGLLALGVGDALASVVGKRLGRNRWSPSNQKTGEGSIAFTLSVTLSALFLRLLGLVEEFPVLRYTSVVALSSLLEAFSVQNDNLILPVYLWKDSQSTKSQQQTQMTRPIHADPPLELADLALSFSRSPEHEITVLSPLPRVPLPPKRVSRKLSRPSTASILDERRNLLPTSHSSGSLTDNSPIGTPATDNDSSWPSTTILSRVRLFFPADICLPVKLNRTSTDRLQTAPASPLSLQMDDAHSDVLSAADRTALEPTYEWSTFIKAYAAGKWDPQKTPQFPRSALSHPTHQSKQTSHCSPSVQGMTSTPDLQPAQLMDGDTSTQPPIDARYKLTRTPPNSTTSPPSSTSTPPKPLIVDPRTSMPERAQSLGVDVSHRLRKSFVDLRLSSGNPSVNLDDHPHQPLDPDVLATAATIRWAGARISVAPLALPSPEHELTDPMRGVNAAIPGVHPTHGFSGPLTPEKEAGLVSPGRRPRLASFWEGTVEQALPTVDGSPSIEPMPLEGVDTGVTENSHSASLSIIPPASAPLIASVGSETDDYFGDAYPLPTSSTSELPTVDSVSSVPAVTRRVCLTRQTSSPLPAFSDRTFRHHRTVRSSSECPGFGPRSVKEESMFYELGYLVAPNPPDEIERRRALYRFNIWNTSPDPSFQRIAYLVKLVFNTKIVVISLIDENEVWFKSECNPNLFFGDEPLVILDTLEDWRFAKNPLVTGGPNIRFHAGAPLKTSDGYNIGTLSIIDDSPRSEFSPRQRHTLKEFATIAMREMELWRDKIQLRIRDRIQTSMEQFTRECLEIDKDNGENSGQNLTLATPMDQIYERAAKLIKRTLDVEGSAVMDVSHVQVLENVNSESTAAVVLHDADSEVGTTTRVLSGEEFARLTEFFKKYPDGKISEGIVPGPCRPFLPTHCQYALSESRIEVSSHLAVPIFNIDKRPFALLCAYNAGDHTTPFLEGHELSYLRAIGVIILSAVLKRRMMLADKAKSLFISNISHELRTPLHGILASAELLSDTPLSHAQASFLQTVQACGTSLVETVNHVLDFTKLSGNARSGGVDQVIPPTRSDLMQLVEEAVEGCWIGHKARLFTSEIGSVYSPPEKKGRSCLERDCHVETVVDIGPDLQDWALVFEKGGIRRVLMNLFGNSLKFTSNGYVHVLVRKISSPEFPPGKVKIEMSVADTGKGISQDFLKNQLFHPFSQENPLQTGTGLGLAIVNSIVRSSSVEGKVDVWSSESVGTDIKISFMAQTAEDIEGSPVLSELWRTEDFARPPSVSLVGFNIVHRGIELLQNVLVGYLQTWWKLVVLPDGSDELGDIIIVNEDRSYVAEAAASKNISRPMILLSSFRGDPDLMSIVTDFENVGGFCRVLYKPGGPSRLHAGLKLCIRSLLTGQRSRAPSMRGNLPHTQQGEKVAPFGPKRHSSGDSRPPLGPRPITIESRLGTMSGSPQKMAMQTPPPDSPRTPSPSLDGRNSPTVTVGTGGILLKSSIGTVDSSTLRARVLVVEDNRILRDLLMKWLKTKGYDAIGAVDGRDGVRMFETEGRFDIVLLDMSMPELDGVGATKEIRTIESTNPNGKSTRILALTGMSTLEDKRRAFEAGVDGYLVKPVAFKTLDEMFRKLGVP